MAGGCQQKSLEVEADSADSHHTPICKEQARIPPSVGDQACTYPGVTRRAPPGPQSSFLSFRKTLQLWPLLAVRGAAPPPWVSSQCSPPPLPTEVPGLLQITAHSKSIPVPTGQDRGDRPGREGCTGQGLKNGNRKGG